MNADRVLIRMSVSVCQNEARIFIVARRIELSLRCLCCRLGEVHGKSEPTWYVGIDARVPEGAVWEILGGHKRPEAIPEVGTPRKVIRHDTKLLAPSFLCEAAVAVDVRHQVVEPCTAAHGGLFGFLPSLRLGDVLVGCQGGKGGKGGGAALVVCKRRCAGRLQRQGRRAGRLQRRRAGRLQRRCAGRRQRRCAGRLLRPADQQRMSAEIHLRVHQIS